MVADEEFKAVGAMVTTELFNPLGAMVIIVVEVTAGVLTIVGSIVIKDTPALGAAEERNEALDADTLGATGEWVGEIIIVGEGVERFLATHSRWGARRVYCCPLPSITTTAARLSAKLLIVRPHPCYSNIRPLSQSTAAIRTKDALYAHI